MRPCLHDTVRAEDRGCVVRRKTRSAGSITNGVQRGIYQNAWSWFTWTIAVRLLDASCTAQKDFDSMHLLGGVTSSGGRLARSLGRELLAGSLAACRFACCLLCPAPSEGGDVWVREAHGYVATLICVLNVKFSVCAGGDNALSPVLAQALEWKGELPARCLRIGFEQCSDHLYICSIC